jgi:hypothetical protein
MGDECLLLVPHFWCHHKDHRGVHPDLARSQLLRIAAVAAVCTGFGVVPASAQALLERVLTQIGSSVPPSGIFANTADNSGAFRDILVETETEVPALLGDASGSDVLFFVRNSYGPTFSITADQIGTTFSAPPGRGWSTITISNDGTITATDTDGDLADTYTFSDPSGGQVLFTIPDNNSFNTDFSEYRIYDNSADRFIATPATAEAANYEGAGFDQVFKTELTLTTGVEAVASDINASVLNVLSGAAAAAAAQSAVSERLSATIGNIGTTGLGAVNTGEILLRGAGIALDETIARALGGTSAAIESRVSAAVTQAGTATGGTLIALNGALNTSGVEASVISVMSGLDVTIGRSGFEMALGDSTFAELSALVPAMFSALTGGVGTTALGAVNTGEIVSGTQTLVQGVISGIVGSTGGDG